MMHNICSDLQQRYKSCLTDCRACREKVTTADIALEFIENITVSKYFEKDVILFFILLKKKVGFSLSELFLIWKYELPDN